jgi:hypothetical protein
VPTAVPDPTPTHVTKLRASDYSDLYREFGWLGVAMGISAISTGGALWAVGHSKLLPDAGFIPLTSALSGAFLIALGSLLVIENPDQTGGSARTSSSIRLNVGGRF